MPSISFAFSSMIRPQKKEQKRVAAMLADMSVGDCVLTTSGFYGIVIDITDDTIIVEFGSNKNCRIPMKDKPFSYFFDFVVECLTVCHPVQLLFFVSRKTSFVQRLPEIYDDIRIDHAKRIAETACDGYALGGLAVGESHEW